MHHDQVRDQPGSVRQALLHRFRPGPAARYVHPDAQIHGEESGDHDFGLDVAGENSPNYLRWIAEMVEPFLGHRVLEIGAGLGSITQHYVAGRDFVATDISTDCVNRMRERFAGYPNVTVLQADIRHFEDAGERFDSIVMINVLEHIADDAGLLRQLRELLLPGGRIVIYVPALNGLYGPWDQLVGHYRRYSRWRFVAIAKEVGLEPTELRYANSLTIPAWFVFSHSNVTQTQRTSLSLWDSTGVPLSRALERHVRIPVGLNMLAVFQVASVAHPPLGGW